MINMSDSIGGIVAGIGGAIEGITGTFSGVTEGTAECGARPLFPGEKRDKWEQCVKAQQNINYDVVLREQRVKTLAIFIIPISLILLVVVLSIMNKK